MVISYWWRRFWFCFCGGEIACFRKRCGRPCVYMSKYCRQHTDAGDQVLQAAHD